MRDLAIIVAVVLALAGAGCLAYVAWLSSTDDDPHG